MHQINLCFFYKRICHQFRETTAPGDFLSFQVLSSLTNLQRRCLPAAKMEKFLSSVRASKIFYFCMAIFTSECCMTISTQYAQDATIMAPKFTPKLNPQVQVLLNLYIHVTDIWWLTNCRDFWWCKTILPA